MPDSPTAANALRIGDSIAQRYQLEALLGADGPSASYRAKDQRLQHTVAIKLRQTLSIDARARAAFERSLATLGALEHPNIALILDQGEWRMGRYVVSEWLEGETLSSRMHRGPLTLEAALAVVRPLLAALASVHAAGLAHGNLKPTNLLLQRRKHGLERVKLLDFAFAKSAGSERTPSERRPASSLRSSAVLRGSLAARFAQQQPADFADGADPYADVYAVGVMLSQMLTGRELSEAEYLAPDDPDDGAPASDASELSGVTPKLPEGSTRDSLVHVPHLDPALLALIQRALAERRADRYADAAEMLCDLIDALPRSLLTPPPADGTRSEPPSAISSSAALKQRTVSLTAQDRRGAATDPEGLAARKRSDSGTFTLPPPMLRASDSDVPTPHSEPSPSRPSEPAAVSGSAPGSSELARAGTGVDGPPSGPALNLASLLRGGTLPAARVALDPGALRRGRVTLPPGAELLLPPPPAGISATRDIDALDDAGLRPRRSAPPDLVAADAPALDAAATGNAEADLQAAIAYARGDSVTSLRRRFGQRPLAGTRPISQLIVDGLAKLSDTWHGLARYIPLPLAAKLLGALAGVLVLTYFVKSEAGRARWNANEGRAEESAALARHTRSEERRADATSPGQRAALATQRSPEQTAARAPAATTTEVDTALEGSGPVAEPLDPHAKPSLGTISTSTAHESGSAARERGPRRLPARDPWTDPVPSAMQGLPALVAAGGEINESTMIGLRVYNRSHPADPRGHLLLGRLYCRRLWRQDCITEYSTALRLDPSARGAADVLPTLIQLVAHGKVAEAAADLIERAYGSEALNAVADAAERARRGEPSARLKALRDRLH